MSAHLVYENRAIRLIPGSCDFLSTSSWTRNPGSGARINMWTATRLELIGSEVRLFCRTQGFPRPSIAWFHEHESQPIVSSGRTSVTESGDLIIRGLSWEDMGQYQCVAKNEDGEDRSTTFLYPVMVSPVILSTNRCLTMIRLCCRCTSRKSHRKRSQGSDEQTDTPALILSPTHNTTPPKYSYS